MRRLSMVLGGWLLTGCLAAGPACALDPGQATTHYRASSWSVANGLPHASISTLFQDREGYLWVGTYQGAARFDGVRFVTLADLSDHQLTPDIIEAIAQTADGALWFGGRYRGLSRLDVDGSLKQFRAGNGLNSDSVTLLRAHPQGGLWLGSGVGLYHATLDGESLHLTAELPQVVWSLVPDRQGRWWAGTESGIWRRERDRWVAATSDATLGKAHFWTIAFDAADRGYAGYRGGLAILDGDFFRPWSLTAALPNTVVRAVMPESQGSLWVATAGGGLLRVKGDVLERFTRRNGLASDVIWEALADREGDLWAGTAAGLSRIGDSLVQTFGETEGLPPGMAWAVAPRRAGGWWLGYNGGGLAAFVDGRRVALPEPARPPAGSAVVQTVLDMGEVQWLGTLGGLFRRDPSGALTPVPELAGIRIHALVADGDGSLLVGTQRGLLRLRDGRVEPIALPGAAQTTVTRLRSDGPGRWLVSAQDAGLYLLDAGTAQRLSDGQGMPIRDAVRAADGRLWIAAVGLYVLAEGRLRPIEPINRNLVTQVHAIEIDTRGQLWASSNAGVLRVEMAALARYLDDENATLDYSVFGEAEGMRSSECNGGTQNPLALAADGSVLVATTEGVVRIEGDAAARRVKLPRPRIERVVVDGVSRDARAGLALPAGLRQMVFDYTALRLSDAERLRFRYRLLPAAPRWSESGSRRSVVFDGLAPGEYRFEVAVSTASEPWTDAVGLDFEVLPLWWQRTDVRFAAALLLLALAAALPLLRVRRLRERERDLAAQVRSRTEALELANAALARAASIDFLTGLPNRRSFAQALDEAFARDAPIALAMLDIDHFKAYNDSAGHLAGDHCLSVFGEQLRDCAEQFGARAARIGGEEFAVLLVAAAVERAGEFLDALALRLQRLQLPHPAPGCGPLLSFSAGLALRDARDLRPEQLIGRADEALYQAKARGRKCWVQAG